MDITKCYNLYEVIKELEIAFQIDESDFEERDADTMVKNVKKRINRQYAIDISEYKVNSDEVVLSSFRESLALFVENIARIHSKFCGCCQIERYHASTDLSLSRINYLGFVESSLIDTLEALQRETFFGEVEGRIECIKEKLGTISNCWEKRLFVLMVISWELGFNEMVACIAEILFQSTFR